MAPRLAPDVLRQEYRDSNRNLGGRRRMPIIDLLIPRAFQQAFGELQAIVHGTQFLLQVFEPIVQLLHGLGEAGYVVAFDSRPGFRPGPYHPALRPGPDGGDGSNSRRNND
ncbi:MAG: hypothetical protein HKM89_12720 [Gemmatimonadales bacterium]|nr:hypothetical protein [Gemmatimonadales bacterium]